MTTVEFRLHPSELLNANQNEFWAKKARKVKALRHRSKIAHRMTRPMGRAHLTVHIGWADTRRRDVSNWYVSVKALVDGAVSDAKVLLDDDNAHLIGPDLRAFSHDEKGVVIVRMEWIEVGPR